jgi:hypothetical protein
MRKNSNHDLLVAGAKDFLKASASVAKFGDEVYDAGLGVLKRREADLKGAGIPVLAKKIKEYPKAGYIGSGDDGTEAFIGPEAPLGNGTFFYLYVWWRADDQHPGRELCSAVASVSCATQAAADALCQALRKRSKGAFNTTESNYEVYTESPLTPEDFVSLEARFDGLVKRWITHGKGIGGLKKYLKF